MLRLVAVLVVLASAASAEVLEWGKASAVIAGVLQWDDPDFADFERRKRQDKVLAESLARLGVPVDRLSLLLDKKAKHDTVLAEVARVAALAPIDGTLVFYFDGHGTRLEDGRVVFATSDIRSGKVETTGLVLTDLTAAIAKSFRGRRVILLADCCHSGGLADVAKALRAKGFQAISITSSEASNESTGDWTYTLALNDALGGRALLDRDRDGQIELGELQAEVSEALLYRELQRSGFDAGDAALDLVLAPARKEPAPRAPKGFKVGDYARFDDDAVVRIVGEEDRQALVESLDYATRTTETADVADLKPLKFETFAIGAELQVEWGGKCWDAKVVKVEGAFHWITYPGWDKYWDEWVADDRIISAGETCPVPE